MYPRNAASPPRIAIGAVVQISDGAVQSSGVSVVVRPEGGSESAGGGTVSYGGTSNVVYYQPTQAETDHTAFVVTAYKTGCVPVSVTVITTASATAGYGGVDWSKVTAATSTVNLSGTTIKTATDVETDTADIQARLPAALVSGRIDASVGAMAANTLTASALATDAVTEIQSGLSTLDAGGVRTAIGLASANLDTQLTAIDDFLDTEIAAIKAKTDILPSAFPTNFASLAITVGGAVTAGTVSDKTGYALTQSFPTNFASLGINSSGHISRVVLCDTTTTNTDALTANGIADAVLSRNVSNVESSAGEHTLCTVVLAMLENSISGTTLTIKRTNGSTTHVTKTLSTNASAEPITGIA